MSAPRVALVGARRVRQGLGPFVAEHLVSAGAEVVGFLGTSDASLAAAAADLAARGVEARGYTALGRLVERERPDALAILSPPETHERYLEAALEAGLHVLCEKPLLWDAGARPGCAARAAALWRGFAERGLLLAENCQWPRVLPAYHALFPEGLGEPPRTFTMRLTPASHGVQMIGDSLPHPLSVLQALRPDPGVELGDVRVSTRDPEATDLTVTFDYGAGGGAIASSVELIQGDRLPREAALSINGRLARRRVRTEDYAQFLGSGEREVPVEDPLRVHLRAFLQDLRATLAGRRPEPDAALPQRARMLERILQTFREDTP